LVPGDLKGRAIFPKLDYWKMLPVAIKIVVVELLSNFGCNTALKTKRAIYWSALLVVLN
jgi:hypothetical protein